MPSFKGSVSSLRRREDTFGSRWCSTWWLIAVSPTVNTSPSGSTKGEHVSGMFGRRLVMTLMCSCGGNNRGYVSTTAGEHTYTLPLGPTCMLSPSARVNPGTNAMVSIVLNNSAARSCVS